MTDQKIPESAALWWVENRVGVRTIARVVVDQADGDPYLGYLPFELLPCGDGAAIPVADFPGTWLAQVTLHEPVDRMQAEIVLMRSALETLASRTGGFASGSWESELNAIANAALGGDES